MTNLELCFSRSELLQQVQSVQIYILVLVSGGLYVLFTHLSPITVKNIPQNAKSNPELSQAQYESIINSFLHEISFKPLISDVSPSLEDRIRCRMERQGVSEEVISLVYQKQCIRTAATMTSYTYPFASGPVKEAIATFAAYAISIDDLTTEFAAELQSYATNLMLRRPQGHSLLQGFTNHLSEQAEIFGSYGGDMIIKGAMEFISSVVVEAKYMDSVHLSKHTTDFLVPFRAKTGVAEPFAFFCFPEDTHPEQRDLEKYLAVIPTLMLFLDYVNDILSFYKEHMKPGDSASFIKSYARMHGLRLSDSLKRAKLEALGVIGRLRMICMHDPKLFGHLEQFIQGYIWFHLRFRRYKLSELNIPLARRA